MVVREESVLAMCNVIVEGSDATVVQVIVKGWVPSTMVPAVGDVNVSAVVVRRRNARAVMAVEMGVRKCIARSAGDGYDLVATSTGLAIRDE